jgi:glutathione-regulated potassium-efflux system ancillary protein KefG
LKKWFDDVLTYGWAFGPQGNHLKGKEFIIATTTGGPENAYRAGGENWFTISELIRPIQRTITKCNGTFLPAFVTYNVTRDSDTFLSHEAKRYAPYIRTPMKELVH